jgi:hypothetical protein
VRGSFRRDLTLARGEGATFRLQRRRGARLVAWGLTIAAIVVTGVDLFARPPLMAGLQVAMSAALIALQVRAELDGWRFDGSNLVRRRFSLTALGFELLTVRARSIREIGVTTSGRRARAWIETHDGDEYALVEGSAPEVEQIAEGIRRSVLLAAAQPPSKSIH